MIFLLHKISAQELTLIKGVFPHISPFIFSKFSSFLQKLLYQQWS